MRSVSGSWNRIILAGAGIVTVIAASWVLASGLNIRERWPAATSFVAPASTRIDSAVMGQEAWLLPAMFAASIIAALLGVLLLIMQVPRKAPASPLRFTDADGTLLATISPEVLSQALSERGEEVSGVKRCSAWVTGSPSNLWVQATATVSQNCEVEWAVSELRNRLDNDLAVSLGAHPKQVDVLLTLDSPSRSRSIASTARTGRTRAVEGSRVTESTRSGDDARS